MKVIGMISGTSYDGIDVACFQFVQSGDLVDCLLYKTDAADEKKGGYTGAEVTNYKKQI